MKKPTKPGTAASKDRSGGALGNIDEQRGDPGKGTGGATMKKSDNPNPSKGEPQKTPVKKPK